MSGTLINNLQIWASTLSSDQDPTFVSKNEMYNAINNLDLGGAPWKCFTIKYNGEIRDGDAILWKQKSFAVQYYDSWIVLQN